ncbi:hypothetical protein L7F22_031512 [Adiantum nelumboides]|nr:hypothetical protein [Adiantum nelumboides]
MATDRGSVDDNALDRSSIGPSLYAAAHCAQSCIRFWNLLLQDTASVNPFGFSIDGYDPADDEEEDEEDDVFMYASPDHGVPQDHAVEDPPVEEEVGALISNPFHAMLTNPRPESYMKPRTVHWWNHHVGFAREDDPDYTDVFRLPVGFLTTICGLCKDDMQQGEIPVSLRCVEGRIFSVERQVAIAVMRLATGSTLKFISQLLGCGLSTVVKVVHKFITSVRQHASSFLQWPMTAESLARVKDGFFEKHRLPNCCGAIDATHVLMELPSGEPADVWMNSSHSFSMMLQAVVDTDLKFLDVCVGYPGSLSNANCLQESSFYSKCCNGQRLSGLPIQIGDSFIGEYVVGDSEYPLLPWLMTPYSQSELIRVPTRVMFNDRLHFTRVDVARAFGRLKGTWRILQSTMKQPNLERVPKLIHACCILHNMCVDAGGVEGIHFPEADAITQYDPDDLDVMDDAYSYEANEARENLCRTLVMQE